jgi:hypothetical protein
LSADEETPHWHDLSIDFRVEKLTAGRTQRFLEGTETLTTEGTGDTEVYTEDFLITGLSHQPFSIKNHCVVLCGLCSLCGESLRALPNPPYTQKPQILRAMLAS